MQKRERDNFQQKYSNTSTVFQFSKQRLCNVRKRKVDGTFSKAIPIRAMKNDKKYKNDKNDKKQEMSGLPSTMQYLKKRGIDLLHKINQGGFGSIHQGKIHKTGEFCAIKFEPRHSSTVRLIAEAKIYTYLLHDTQAFQRGIPHIYCFGHSEEEYIMVMQLMGPSLENLKGKRVGHKFSLRTVLLLADQMINTIHYVHQRNLIHHDIKPDNFCMGTGQYSHNLYLIDFGLARTYREGDLSHVECLSGKHLTGTVRYASVNMHKGLLQSRRDDMQSIGFVLIYLYTGSLPWCNVQAKDKQQKKKKIKQIKQNINLIDMCKGCPVEFIKYMAKVRRLSYDEQPPYEELRQMFAVLYNKRGYPEQTEYDWTLPPNLTTTVQNHNLGSVNLVPLRYDRVKKNVVLASPVQVYHDDFHPYRQFKPSLP